MKVVVFVEYFPPRLGSDRRIFEIMRRLSSKHEVHFVVLPPVQELRDKLPRNKKTTTDYEGIHGHTISISPKIAMLWRHSLIIAYCLTAISMFLKLARIIRKVNSDVIVLNYPSPYTGFLGFLGGKLWKKPIVLDFNDLIAQYTINLLKLEKDSFKAKLLVLVQHYLIKNSRKVITPTRFIMKYTRLLSVPEREIAIIPNGVDTKCFHPDRFNASQLKFRLGLSKEKLCVYCGRLDEWAGTNIISKLCDIAAIKKLDVKFLLVGDGAEKPVHKQNIAFLGEIPHEEIPAVLTNADVILIPFPNNEVSHAASPIKLFEGMAMQKPVIASKVSGIEDVVSDGENGFLADPDNVNEWVEKLETILKYENIAKKIGQNARRTVETEFEWALLAKQYEEILNSIRPIQVQAIM